VDRIRKLAQDARKDGHEAYAKSLFDIAEDVEREGETISVGVPLEFAPEQHSILEPPDAPAGVVCRVLDVLRIDRIVLERTPQTQTSSMERTNGEDEESA
jgi:hypothetical protein